MDSIKLLSRRKQGHENRTAFVDDVFGEKASSKDRKKLKIDNEASSRGSERIGGDPFNFVQYGKLSKLHL